MVPIIAVNYSFVNLVPELFDFVNLAPKLSDFDSLVPEVSNFDNLALPKVSQHSRFICGVRFWLFCFYLGEVR